jgi:hypothetical protein
MLLPLLTFVAVGLIQGSYRERFPLPSNEFGSGWGVNLGFDEIGPAEEARLKESGLQWVRRDLFWHEIERKKGAFDFAKWDRLLKVLGRLGMRPVFILDYGNDLYQTGAPRTPAARAAFCRYVEAALQHFRGRGVVWEMWNEPHGAQYWPPTGDGDEYIDLALEVGKTIRRVAPDEWFVGPAMAGFDLPFLDRCLARGMGRYWDAITVHPYRPMEPESVLGDYARTASLLARHDAKLPVFSGEWGYSAATSGIDEEVQARYFARQYLANLASGVPMSVWYNWKNNGGNAKVEGDNYGLVRSDLEPKPAFQRATNLLPMLKGRRFEKRLSTTDPNEWFLLFSGGLLVAWTTGSPRVFPKPFLPGPYPLRLGSDPLVLLLGPGHPLVRAAAATPTLPPIVVADRPSELIDLLKSFAKLGAGNTLEVFLDGKPFDPSKPSRTALREDAPRRLRVSVLRPGDPAVTQEALVMPRHPVTITASAPTNGEIAVSVTGAAKDAKVRLVIGNREIAPRNRDLHFPYRGDNAFVVSVKEQGIVVGQTPPMRPIALSMRGLSVAVEGDPGVAGTAEIKARTPLAVSYRFAAGWKYALGILAQSKPLQERPIRYGIWVEGDGSGTTLTCRYVDASGQTFQPQGIPISWRGWKYVEFPVRGETGGRWGGANDGTIHYPIRLLNPFVLDNTGGSAHSGAVRFKNPFVMAEATIP